LAAEELIKERDISWRMLQDKIIKSSKKLLEPTFDFSLATIIY
jgi:hypothetical protein